MRDAAWFGIGYASWPAFEYGIHGLLSHRFRTPAGNMHARHHHDPPRGVHASRRLGARIRGRVRRRDSSPRAHGVTSRVFDRLLGTMPTRGVTQRRLAGASDFREVYSWKGSVDALLAASGRSPRDGGSRAGTRERLDLS